MRKRYKFQKIRKLFSLFLLVFWIGLIAFASFSAPAFLGRLPFFKVKEIIVEGNEYVSLSAVRKTVADLEENLLTLKEENFLSALNIRTEGRVKTVFINRSFGLDGISLNIKIVERKPIAKIKIGKGYLLIDAEGVLFKPMGEDLKKLPLLKVYNFDILKKHISHLANILKTSNLTVNYIDIKKDKILLRTSKRTVILPPLELLSENVSYRLKMIYNLQEKEVDLRYDRFILVRN